MDNSEVVDLIDGAADLLESDGWIQNATKSPRGYCAVGALSEVIREESDEDWMEALQDAVSKVSRYLFDEGHPNFTVTGWNDQDGRTKEEVISGLRGAASALRS